MHAQLSTSSVRDGLSVELRVRPTSAQLGAVRPQSGRPARSWGLLQASGPPLHRGPLGSLAKPRGPFPEQCL